MRALIAIVVLGLAGLATWAWLAFGRAPEGAASAAPTAERPAAATAVVESSERAPLAVPERHAPPAPADDAPEGGEDAVGSGDDAGFARKYAAFDAAALEAALDELAHGWHAARGAAIDAALTAGNYTSTVVAPADLDAKLKELTEAATKAGDLFTSRTIPYGQGVMLELQFVRIARVDDPALFAAGDEVRWLERALEQTRREDTER